MNVVWITLQVINIVTWLLLFLYGMHYYLICFLFLRKKRDFKLPEPTKLSAAKKRKVLIQLPIFNELYVVERLIRNIAGIRWPKQNLEIQVLDDSTDETTKLARKLVAEYKKKGLNIKLIHRIDRVGHKAGALKEGMAKSKAEFIAIFDSDFLPESDFLERTIPYLMADDKAAFVQTRWDHVNKEYSGLTYAQALAIDGHFTVEQNARSMHRLWMNFNGTAGVWRKIAIEDAGNWSGDTLTEDLDLSYRAQLNGWSCYFLPDVRCPAEIPHLIMPYKAQQFRWAKGSIQTAKKLLGKVLKAKAKLRNKAEAAIHLTYYSVQFLMILNLLSLAPLVIGKQTPSDISFLIPFVLFTFGLFAPVTLTLVAQKHLKNKSWKAIKALPFLFCMGLGISVYICVAFIEAIAGKKSSFIRTPKFGIGNTKSNEDTKKKYGNLKFSYVLYLEIIFSLFFYAEAGFIFLNREDSNMIFFYFPVMMAVALTYVVYRTIKDTRLMRRPDAESE